MASHNNTSSTNNEATNGHKQATAIQTFVFMDLEATSLLEGRQKPRILEFCFVAVHRSDLMAQQGVTPRVINKLTLCVYPGKPISYGASEITGLYNDTLENQKRLSDKTVLLLNSFLDHLTKPVCLLAHNGNGYDFPLLQAELRRIKQALPDDILCADTLEAFRSLDGLPSRYSPFANQNNNQSNQSITPKSTQSTHINHNPPPVGVKRKSIQGEASSIDTGTKVVKHNVEQFDVTVPVASTSQVNQAADKVKKKLFVDELKSDEMASAPDSKKQSNGEEDDDQTEEVDEFASSLENEDYLLALEDAEKQLSKSDESKSKENGTSKSDVDSIDIIEKGPRICPLSMKSMESANDMNSVQKDNGNVQGRSKPCYVEAGTGYFIRENDTAAEGHEHDKMDDKNDNDVNNASSAEESEVNHGSNESTRVSSSASSSLTESNTLPPSQSVLSSSASALTSQSSSSSSSSSSQTSLNSSSQAQSSPAASLSLLNSHPPIQSSSLVAAQALTTSSSPSLSSVAKPSPSTSSNKPSTPSNTSTSKSNITPDRPIASTSYTPTYIKQANQSGKKLSYKLEEIYLRKFGSKPEIVHSAEGDCVTMLKIFGSTQGIIGWVDEHAKLLADIMPAF